MNHTIKIIAKIAIILVSVGGYAQTPINLEEAYQKALMHNPNLKSSALKAKYKEAMQSSYKEIDPLNISAEYGQINSAYTDNRLSMVQTFKLPTVYTRQK